MMPRFVTRRPSWSALLLAACLAFACGGDGSNGPNSDPVPIRGGERLAWNQPASSVDVVRGYTFRLYVDGARSALGDTRCSETSTAAGYECSGRLPNNLPAGQHTLELASVSRGTESPRSAPLTVIVMPAASTATMLPQQTDAAPPSTAPSSTCSRVGGGCYDIRVLADGLMMPSLLTTTSDGRQFFVEEGRQIRVIQNGVLLPDVALALPPDTATRIVGMAADSQFERTRAFFVAWSEDFVGGTRQVNVTRYREVGNTLGEGAQILTGLPLHGDSPVPLGVDAAGLVYVALPGVDRAQPFGGAVLRVDRDGATPADNPGGSPIVATGFAAPMALAVDVDDDRIWLAGTYDGRPQVASFGIVSVSEQGSPLLPLPGSITAEASGSPWASLSLRRTGDRSLALAATNAGLMQGQTSGLDVAIVDSLPLSGVPTSVTHDDRAWYVAVVGEDGRGQILALSPRP